MRIAITTPTGNVGSQLAPMLVRAGVRPLLLMRDPAKLPAELQPLVDVAVVDQFDESSIKDATTGVDALYWVNPSTMSADPIADHEQFGRALASAAASNGIPKIVFQSSIGAEKRHGVGDIDGLARTEEMLNELDASVTHLRCGYFFTNVLMDIDMLKQGTFATAQDLDYEFAWVDPRDVAEMAMGALLAPASPGIDVRGVHGPRDLSFKEAARIITESTGKEVTATRISVDDLRQMLASAGMSPKAVDAIVGMTTGFYDYTPEVPRSAATTTPSLFEEWCFTHLRPLLR